MRGVILAIISYLRNFCGDPNHGDALPMPNSASTIPTCSAISQQTLILTTGEELPSNLLHTYNANNKVIGQGAFGKVKSAQFKEIEHETVIKMSQYRDQEEYEMMLQEANVMRALNEYPFTPKLYACKKGLNYFLLVQEKINDGDLVKGKSKTFINNLPLEGKLRFFKIGFEGLAKFQALKLVHNDIKPANMMAELPCSKSTDHNCRHENLTEPRLYFIDFGFAEYTSNTNVSRKGTPYYFSPGRQKYQPYHPRDDLYAYVLSMAEILSKIEDVFSIIQKRNGRKIYNKMPNVCFLGVRSEKCKKILMENVKEIFTEAGFDKYLDHPDPKKKSLINLLVSVVEYDNLSVTASDILKEISEALRVLEAQRLLEEEKKLEAERQAEIIRQNVILKKEAANKKREDLKKAKEALQKEQDDLLKEQEELQKQQDELQKQQEELQKQQAKGLAEPIAEPNYDNCEFNGNRRIYRLLARTVILPNEPLFYGDLLDNKESIPPLKASVIDQAQLEKENLDVDFDYVEALISQYQVSSSEVTDIIPPEDFLDDSYLADRKTFDHEEEIDLYSAKKLMI